MIDLTLKHKTPCAQCPWRKLSPAGWLGGHSVKAYSEPVKHGVLVPCHMHPRQDIVCAGSATVMRNSCTIPRDPIQAAQVEQVERSDTVFMFVTQFEEHHHNGALYHGREKHNGKK